jgi:hypothetical protein
MASNLQLDDPLSPTSQSVRDDTGAPSPLGLAADQVVIEGGPVTITNPGDGSVLLTLGTERPWVLKQSRSGKTTALELTAADPSNNNKDLLINTDGRVGIGTTVPEAKLHVANGGAIFANQGDGKVVLTLGTERAWVFKQRFAGKSTALELTAADQGNNNKNFLIMTDGRVGIGTREPKAKLDVQGSVSVLDDIVIVRADCAEEFDINESSYIDPGTVMVIGGDGDLTHSTTAYDRRVAGIVSGAGAGGPGIVLGRRKRRGPHVPIALCGTVPCRVDAVARPIETGDLLTTSATPGLAMAAADRDRSFGAVIGKALGGLSEGFGVVPALVALQ